MKYTEVKIETLCSDFYHCVQLHRTCFQVCIFQPHEPCSTNNSPHWPPEKVRSEHSSRASATFRWHQCWSFKVNDYINMISPIASLTHRDQHHQCPSPLAGYKPRTKIFKPSHFWAPLGSSLWCLCNNVFNEIGLSLSRWTTLCSIDDHVPLHLFFLCCFLAFRPHLHYKAILPFPLSYFLSTCLCYISFHHPCCYPKFYFLFLHHMAEYNCLSFTNIVNRRLRSLCFL